MTKVTYRFEGITDVLKESIKWYVEHHLEQKADSYLKHFSSQGVEVVISVDIEKHPTHSPEMFEGKFVLDSKLAGFKSLHYERSFENVKDLVSHAFDHFKQELADRK